MPFKPSPPHTERTATLCMPMVLCSQYLHTRLVLPEDLPAAFMVCRVLPALWDHAAGRLLHGGGGGGDEQLTHRIIEDGSAR